MKIALIYPPIADPTAPYISVPALTGYLRAHDQDVLPIDANIEACDWLLEPGRLAGLAGRVNQRLARLERKGSLSHKEQLAYLAFWGAKGAAQAVPQGIKEALTILRQPDNPRFYRPEDYEAAVATVTAALELISAAYTPLALGFSAYRTPFAMLNPDEIKHDAGRERSPFYDYFVERLLPILEQEKVQTVGISVVFPGQLQSAFTLAYLIREKLPGVYLTAGGPAFTQLFAGLDPIAQERLRCPFHSIVLYEGEEALLALLQDLNQGKKPEGVILGTQGLDLAGLAAPDFTGLPLTKYFAPELVLPYDTSRGCYWGRCAFCHYGLTKQGTARYRERPVAQVVRDLTGLMTKHGAELFYFSEDLLAPTAAAKLAEAFIQAKAGWQWASDIRPEPSLTLERSKLLAQGGALSLALGLESGAPRVLNLINKGVTVAEATAAARHLAQAGIAVEGMYFLHFPTESEKEAMATISAIKDLRSALALFICGEFALTGGARIAFHPADYQIKELWYAQGDEFKTKLFYKCQNPELSGQALQRLDDALEQAASHYWLHSYPWAGSLSTAHTLLWVKKYGPDIFKKVALKRPADRVLGAKPGVARAHFDLNRLQEQIAESEAAIWQELLYQKRQVSRSAYNTLAEKATPALPRPHYWSYEAGWWPEKTSRK